MWSQRRKVVITLANLVSSFPIYKSLRSCESFVLTCQRLEYGQQVSNDVSNHVKPSPEQFLLHLHNSHKRGKQNIAKEERNEEESNINSERKFECLQEEEEEEEKKLEEVKSKSLLLDNSIPITLVARVEELFDDDTDSNTYANKSVLPVSKDADSCEESLETLICNKILIDDGLDYLIAESSDESLERSSSLLEQQEQEQECTLENLQENSDVFTSAEYVKNEEELFVFDNASDVQEIHTSQHANTLTPATTITTDTPISNEECRKWTSKKREAEANTDVESSEITNNMCDSTNWPNEEAGVAEVMNENGEMNDDSRLLDFQIDDIEECDKVESELLDDMLSSPLTPFVIDDLFEKLEQDKHNLTLRSQLDRSNCGLNIDVNKNNTTMDNVSNNNSHTDALLSTFDNQEVTCVEINTLGEGLQSKSK